MSDQRLRDHLRGQLDDIELRGLTKRERFIQGPQGSAIRVQDREVVNFCANNYLGLANHPDVVAAARSGLERYGYGMASVRFICGTQDIHKSFEASIAKFFGKDDAILYSSCWDANGGLFETILTDADAIISDELNHASIIDGVRLCKARRFRYKNCDLADLKRCLEESKDCRFRMIATDGVFSMDGSLAPLPEICDLADKYDAIVMVDDSHATGVLGPGGRGTPEELGVQNRIDILTSTLGKTLGGAAGGFTCARQEIVDLLRQRSRPYLFSNALPPPIVMAAAKALDMVQTSGNLRERMHANARSLRGSLESAGFNLKPGRHPILPVMLGEAALATKLADRLLQRGIYVIGFSFPVVPQGQARIRLQLSAAHTPEQLALAATAFVEAGRELGVIK
jgi:glycine C-acetyltransferase